MDPQTTSRPIWQMNDGEVHDELMRQIGLTRTDLAELGIMPRTPVASAVSRILLNGLRGRTNQQIPEGGSVTPP